METKVFAARWDDIVFANRNQEYGAYRIRKAYSQNVIIGWGITIAIVTMILLLPRILPAPAKMLRPILKPPGDIEFTDFILPVKPPKPQRIIHQTQPRTQDNLNVRVVHEEVIETPPVEEPVEDTFTGSEDGVDGGVVDAGVQTGTGDVPVVAPPTPPWVMTAEVMPVYKGGMEALMKFVGRNIHYPPSARRMGIEGTIYISFVVNGDGTVTHVSILRGIHPQCDAEAMRVVGLLPDWIGGKQAGMPVNVKMVLPIKFSLQNL